ncbi:MULTISPECIES: outer membrane protein assembly factor BamE [unclassified Herbaspirillum]|uniref:outer membrane protein assembly factor BamE n=1 Tax=unclassified Herbaspirillum TaxID=2624150 RepID=UPI00116DF3FF|nr:MULTISPECIES: outer membrane protein assembly factor BamE [unclassified Herbaspirillum]MBB5392437.1 outer membrane protein assembly factor BamE [Herbaspirillum sp. SJZ102]TQK06076.1 outer membrane protein assembly factor BamE [Herbaspirillum sp. SJZ130]TQK12446.1 outer membrane protein assembly factor BamE [Herbaspirillum sp. SJZ106]TWC68285.1 outer membrane protein assembly factor BamE [Herbaspirillum sp. SJZ099]
MKSHSLIAVIGMFAALSVALSGCSSTKAPEQSAATDASGVKVTGKSNSLFGFLKPYRIDIQQGNFVSREMVAQVRPGLTRDQVRFVLGTPLLNDMFHSNRWDYDFRLAKGNGEIMSSRVSVFFKDGLVEHVDGGEDLPTESEYLTLITNSKAGAKAAFTSSSDVKPAAPEAPSSSKE